MLTSILILSVLFSLIFSVSHALAAVVKSDIGMQIQAGKIGPKYPNVLPEVFIHDGTDPLWTLQDTKDRFLEVKANIDTLLGTDYTVLKMNYPAFADIVSETAADNVDLGTVTIYATIKTRDGGLNSEPLYITFKGIPQTKTKQQLYDAISALLTESLGTCADGVTPRFVSMTPVDKINVSAMKTK